MSDYLKNQEAREPKEIKETEQVVSPEQGVTLGSVVAGHMQQIQDDKKKLRQEVDEGTSELLRLNHNAAANVLKSESDEILSEAERAGEEYMETLKKDIPDLEDQLNMHKKQAGTTGV